MELKYLWNLILRRNILIIQAFLVILIIAAVVSFLIPDTYTSRGKIYNNSSQNITSSILGSLGLSELSDMFPTAGSTLIEDDFQQIQMRPCIEEMSRRLLLIDEDCSYLNPEKIIEPGLKQKLKGAPSIKITQIEGSSIIEIEASSTLPEEAMQMVNTLANIFIDKILRRATEQYQTTRIFVEKELKSVSALYDNTLNDLRVFQEKYGGIEISKEVELAIERLAMLMTEMEENKLELREADASLKNIEQQLKGSKDLIVISREFKNNDLIEILKQRMADLNLKYAEKKVEYRENHPHIQSIKKQIEEAKTQLGNQLTKIFGSEISAVNPTQEKLNSIYIDRLITRSILEIRNHAIPQLIKKYELKLKKLPAFIQKYNTLNLSLKVNEEVYKTLLSYKQSIGVAESMSVSRIKLVEPGFLPDKNTPSNPKRPLILILASFTGLFAGIGLALLIDYFDDSIKNLEEVDELKDFHVLGSIPEISQKKLSGATTIIKLKSDSPIYETYRSVRNNIRFILDGKKANSFIVTSTSEHEGKTKNVCNLGLAFAKTGISVIILDLDFRRPQVHEMFQLPNQQGVSSILMQQTDYHEVVQQVGYDGQVLDVITTGPTPIDVGLLVESENMKKLILDMKKSYDLVILDSPPSLFLTDALILGKYVDGAVWIMDLKATNIHSAIQTKRNFVDAGVDILGILINRKQRKTEKYYYGYYQGYYSE